MSKLEQIEAEITQLTPDELRQLSQWLAEYQAGLRDHPINENTEVAGLDSLFKGADTKRKNDELHDWLSDHQ